MKNILLAIASLFSVGALCQTIGLETYASGFTAPTEINHPAGDARLFVVQQGGLIRIINPDKTVNPTPFLNISTIISCCNERGLLGLAFHPNYATNGYLYINYTDLVGTTTIARYHVSANPNVADGSSGTILLTVAQPFANHNGGTLRFGPDGYLYIGMGDGGSGGDPGNRAQNIHENLGKMLRIDVDSASPYAIPPGNPYAGVDGNDEIWAIGLRNPWKFSFNRLNHDLWIADVGQGLYEEINKVSPTAAGLNYGWNCYEGNNVYTTGCALPTVTYTFPIATYSHSFGCSITGGYFYTGSAYPNFANKYFFADYCSNKIGYTDNSGVITWSAAFAGSGFTTFGEDINGELYVAGTSNGIVSKLIDTSLATKSFSQSTVQLYPNPASSEVFIQSDRMSYPATVTISDLTGKRLLQEPIASASNAVSTAALQGGIYLVTVKDLSGANYTAKLTVK